MIVLFPKRLCGRRVRSFRFIELAEVGIRQSDVVENLRRVVEHAKSPVPGKTSLECFERSPDVAPDAGDRAEILIDHGHCFGVSDRFRSAARLSVNELSPIEIAATLVDDRDYVEGLCDLGRRSGLSSGGNCRF